MANDIIPATPQPPRRADFLELDGILPPELEFTPVTTKSGRQKFVPELQRKFIQALSITGSVRVSAEAVGMSSGQVYDIKMRTGAESLCAAWEKAICMGGYRARDTIVDHAINGTPEYFYKDGELVGERRHFNLRAMQWVVAHTLPHLADNPAGLAAHGGLPTGLQKLKAEWRKEWEAEAAQAAATRAAEYEAAYNSQQATLARLCQKYQAKIREEYFYRQEGNAIAADFTLRQMTLLEVVMDVGGVAHEMIRQHFHTAPHGGPWTTQVSRALEDARHAAWEKASAEALGAYNRAAQEPGVDPAELGPAPEAYVRPKMPWYLTEEDHAADHAAHVRAMRSEGDNWRQRVAREEVWRASRRTQSEAPGEGDTFLPGG
jgi:hypothetical protein